MRTLVITLKNKIINFNIFQISSRRSDYVRRQIWATRIYAITFLIIVISFFFYTLLAQRSTKITVERPIQDQYEYLLQLYPDTLECDCKQVISSFGNLVNINAVMHQICSSDFVNSNFSSQFRAINTTVYFADFIMQASSYFHLIESLCVLARSTIQNAYNQFQLMEYVSKKLLSPEVFTQQMTIYVDGFTNSTSNKFAQSLSFTQDMTRANQFFSNLLQNSFLYLDFQFNVQAQSVSMGNKCICSLSDNCTLPSKFVQTSNDLSVYVTLWDIPGMFQSCFATESLILSTLECWYNQECLDTFVKYSSEKLYRSFIRPQLLNSSKTRYPLNMTFGYILNSILVEEWTFTSNFSSFFSNCAPQICNYTITKRNDFLTVVKDIIGVYSGLNQILSFFIPLVVYILFSIYYHSISQAPMQGSKYLSSSFS